jgi:hypothetical protein
MSEIKDGQKEKCMACKHCYLPPDAGTYVCGLKGGFGKYYHRSLKEDCPDNVHFEQHPLRNEDGTFKAVS